MRYFKIETLGFVIIMQCVYLIECILEAMRLGAGVNVISVADYLVFMSSDKIFLFVEIALIITAMYYINKDDYINVYLVRKKNRRKMYLIQQLRAAGLAAFMTLYREFSIIIWLKLSGMSLINWSDTDSFFFNRYDMIAKLNFGEFIWRHMLEVFFAIFGITTIALLTEWSIRKIVSYFVIFAIPLVESSSFINGSRKLFYGRIISKSCDIIYVRNVLGNAAFACVLILILVAFGTVISKRKEFI